MAGKQLDKLEGVFTFDEDKKNTKLFRPEANKEEQLSNALYLRKDKLAKLGSGKATKVKITIEEVTDEA